MLAIFDGHNDSIQRLQEYQPDGVDFLVRSTDGHLDLPRAKDGGRIGGLFAMFVRPEHPPVNHLIVRKGSYEVRLAEPLDTAYGRRKTRELLTALKRLAARADGKIGIATSLNEIDSVSRAGSFAVVLHLEGITSVSGLVRKVG
jgi:membrane dipeptidase